MPGLDFNASEHALGRNNCHPKCQRGDAHERHCGQRAKRGKRNGSSNGSRTVARRGTNEQQQTRLGRALLLAPPVPPTVDGAPSSQSLAPQSLTGALQQSNSYSKREENFGRGKGNELDEDGARGLHLDAGVDSRRGGRRVEQLLLLLRASLLGTGTSRDHSVSPVASTSVAWTEECWSR